MRRRSLPAVVLFSVLVLAGCGADDTDLPELSVDGEQGRQLAQDNSCRACHGSNGQGASGPAWIGLLDRERELTDGSTVTADRDYLLEAILEPNSQVVEGFTIRMPENALTPEEAGLIVTYIEELADAG